MQIVGRWKRTALRAGLCYVVLALVLSGCADRLILYPSRDPIAVPGAVRREVAGPVGAVEVWTMPSPSARRGQEPQAFVMEFVGNGSRAEWSVEYIAEQWGNRPVEVWAVNYPGYGGSAGSAKLKSIAPAALAAYDAMKQRAGDRPTFVSGHSIGTTAALCVAARRPVSGCVLHNPPPLRNLILSKFGWWNLWLAAIPVSLQVPREIDSLANGKNAHAPAVFILAGADTLVPPKFQQKVVDAYAGPKQLVRLPTSGHNDPVGASDWGQLQSALDWLWAQSVRPAVP